jgi:hypothetical protein
MKRVATVTAIAVLLAACSDTVTEPRGPSQPNLRGASAHTTECRGFLPPAVYDDVVVPPGESCAITAAVITGHLIAYENSRLVSTRNTVGGGIEALGAAFVHLDRDEVDGNIRIFDGPGQSEVTFSYRILNVIVHNGHVRLFRNTGDILISETRIESKHLHVYENIIPSQLLMVSNVVGRHIEVLGNRGPGSKIVQFNTAGEYVRCENNEPPFVGWPNVAPRNEGQCSAP